MSKQYKILCFICGIVVTLFMSWLVLAGVRATHTIPPSEPLLEPGILGRSKAQSLARTLSSSDVVWDSEFKAISALASEDKFQFTFYLTNISSGNVTLLNVRTSCGCTTAKLPSLPWVLPSGSNGQIDVIVKVAGSSGTFVRTVNIETDQGCKQLSVKITFPEVPVFVAHGDIQNSLPTSLKVTNQNVMPAHCNRQNDLRIEKIDRQSVFKNECALCHSQPSDGKFGRDLYRSACGICHDDSSKGSIVPNLRAIQDPTSHASWQKLISLGKPGTLMPAFSKSLGGPLTEAQISSIAAYLTEAIPFQGAGAQ